MVAGKQVPDEITVTAQTLEAFAAGLGLGGVGLENVSGDQNVPGAAGAGGGRQPVDCAEPGFAQQRRLIGGKGGETLADLPVGAVKESESHDGFSIGESLLPVKATGPRPWRRNLPPWPEVVPAMIEQLELLVRLAVAAGFGAIIGIDREAKARPAGLRTHMLTSLAAAAFTILAIELHRDFARLAEPVEADPLRIIEAVTAGVAFLAAGTIIQSRGQVYGVTTGAGMWLAGAIGLACGAGKYLIAAVALVLAMAIMSVLRPLEKRLWPDDSKHDRQPGPTPGEDDS